MFHDTYATANACRATMEREVRGPILSICV